MLPRRIAAFLLDLLAFLVIAAGSWFALTGTIKGSCTAGGFTIGGDCHGFDDNGKRAVWFAILVVSLLVIYVILPGIRSTSPGHAAMRLRITKLDGSRPGIARALVRFVLLWTVDFVPFLVPWLVAFVTVWRSKRRQRVGDMLAGTLVGRATAAP